MGVFRRHVCCCRHDEQRRSDTACLSKNGPAIIEAWVRRSTIESYQTWEAIDLSSKEVVCIVSSTAFLSTRAIISMEARYQWVSSTFIFFSIISSCFRTSISSRPWWQRFLWRKWLAFLWRSCEWRTNHSICCSMAWTILKPLFSSSNICHCLWWRRVYCREWRSSWHICHASSIPQSTPTWWRLRSTNQPAAPTTTSAKKWLPSLPSSSQPQDQ